MNADYFRRLARYNRWANRRLYEACGRLSDEEYFAPRTGFFPSIHKTLNHILLADRIWLGRFEQKPSGIDRLDAVLYEERAALSEARAAEDERILRLVGAYDDAALAADLHYRNMAGEPKQYQVGVLLGHLFNHQTHHRGQAHAMLSGTPVPPPELDLLLFLPEDRD